MIKKLVINEGQCVGIFYGLEQKGMCGGGIYLKINASHYYKNWLGCGIGTNTKVELLPLWGSLNFASKIGIVSIQIFGDSKVIVEWDKGFYGLHVITFG